MKCLFLTGIVFISCLCLPAQDIRMLHQAGWPENDSDTLWYTVKGERHGSSFFRQHRFTGVEYVMGENLVFDRYHTADVMTGWLKKWAERYPDLLDLYIVDHSFEGRPIIQVTLTNKKTGRDTDKPAAYFEGGRHSGEITASESVLWLLDHLLQGYGDDPEITRIIDTRALYLRPVNNPDGESLYLHTAQFNRSTVRPQDNDGDGLTDEDPGEDLDGDGVLYSMRWKAREGEKGNAIPNPADPSGRIMKRVPEGTGTYMVSTEGTDNDGDGKFNEDGIGGLDLHRNYAENWRPGEGKDATGRGYTQTGAGEYPLSEPETRSVALWMLTHPNIYVVNSMDTRVPMHLRPPSTSFQEESMFPEDLAWYEYFDSVGKSITRYPWAGDVYNTYHTRIPVSEWSGDSTQPSPLFGHGPDFGYFYLGAIWYGDELWDGGMSEDYNGDGRLDQLDALMWDDKENGGRGFREWTPFHHPYLGEVETGGFHPKFFSQNPPPDKLERWVRKQGLFNLEMVKHLPLIEITGMEVTPLTKYADSTIYSLNICFTNTGRMPTALSQARMVKIVKDDEVQLVFDKELTGNENPRVKIISPPGREKVIKKGITLPGQEQKVEFRIVKYGRDKAEGTVKVSSTRGGMAERTFTLDP